MSVEHPEADASEWLTAGVPRVEAQVYADAAVPVALALQWTDAELDADNAVDFLDKGVPQDQVLGLHERGIRPEQITATDTGFDIDLEPWQEDPLHQLPAIVTPGRFRVSLWSVVPWDGSHIENEVFLNWDGGHTVEWSVLSGSGLLMMSEVSINGLGGWPDGKDALISYTGEFGDHGFTRLVGAAPAAPNADGASTPEEWLDFATALVALAEELMDSGIEARDELAHEYRRCADDEWFEFNDMFRIYLDSAPSEVGIPDFDDWIKGALEDGTYETG